MNASPSPSIPQVSVVIPCYGYAHLLQEAVGSVIAQTFPDWELVIVDDGSPDETAAVAEELIRHHPDRRIRLVRQANAGLSMARNAGIAASSGRLILPLDADDMIAPRFLEVAVRAMDSQPSVAIVCLAQEPFGEVEYKAPAIPFPDLLIADLNSLSYCSLYRREVWEAVGGYNPNMRWGYEDWDFWVGALERGFRPLRLPDPLFLYRHHGTSMRTNAGRHHRELRAQMRLNHPRSYRPLARLARLPLVLAYMLPMRLSRRTRRAIRELRGTRG